MSQKEQILERIKLSRAMMEHPGWVMLVKDWEEEVDALKQQLIYSVSTEGLSGLYRGKLDVLERLINLPKILDAVESGLEDLEGEE